MTKAWLRIWIIDPKHALGNCVGYTRVAVLHAIGQHERGDLAQLLVVFKHKGLLESSLVAAQTGSRCVAGIERLDSSLAGIHAAGECEVDALEPDARGETQCRSVAGHHDAVTRECGDHAQAGLGNEMRRILLELGTLDERCHGRMQLERCQDLFGTLLLCGEF